MIDTTSFEPGNKLGNMELVELTGEWNSIDRERMRCQNYDLTKATNC